ncbi:hypothetical protein JAB9_47460 [Janthinobacterium sp. HH107]|uniref:hypothetical protein n=1 Tax=Janthinobacterium sp. HH107 TaxID=1537279 RepID=UPI0008734F5C|nr:hypothetical protein [Janthinobacterium sp. HH107]OEZ92180.1 hypothetical protein JAB9_47460 [Janthinobacterium sp. HH107]
MALKIVSAIYGNNGKIADVTAKVQDIVKNGNDDVLINNVTLGIDPDIGKGKQFASIYFYEDGTIHTISGKENDTLDFVK